jgi:signal peptidase I
MLADSQGNASMELACGLTEEVIRNFGEVRLRVFGTSMVPSILPGDLVLIQRANLNEISQGEIVLFLRAGRLFVHRVINPAGAATADGFAEPCLITRGDRLRQDDGPVSSSELLGRVVSVERDNRKIDFKSNGSNRLMVRLLQSSDRVTSIYLRLASYWRTIFLGRAKCQV